MKKKTSKTPKPSGPKPKPSTKKAFALGRDSIYVADPLDLRICGGRGVLPPEESGPLDTAPGPEIPVQDMRRLRKKLRPGFLASVARFKVRVPIVIAKIDDVATILVGKRRARAARRENRLLEEQGKPTMKLRCVIQRDTSRVSIQETVILENNAREDDDLLDRIEKLKAHLEASGNPSLDDAAVVFGVERATLKDWLAYDDQAIDATKQAVAQGTIRPSTGLELARERDPAQQRTALARVVAHPPSQRSARRARAIVRGEADRPSATDRRSQRALYEYVRTTQDHARGGFWSGVLQTLALVTAREGGGVDATLVNALEAARAPKGGAGKAAKAEEPKAGARGGRRSAGDPGDDEDDPDQDVDGHLDEDDDPGIGP